MGSGSGEQAIGPGGRQPFPTRWRKRMEKFRREKGRPESLSWALCATVFLSVRKDEHGISFRIPQISGWNEISINA